MKQSKYNIEVQRLENNKMLFFNSVTRAFVALDENTYNYICAKKITLPTDDDELAQNMKLLNDMGFLVEDDLDELTRIELNENRIRYGSKKLAFTIGTTLDCNMACPYCFESKSETYMTEEIATQVISFIENEADSSGAKAITIAWYGGEPLMNQDVIRQISESLISYCASNSIEYSASIITNGYFLDVNVARALKEDCAVRSAQITVDGFEEIHNQRRCLKNGENSFWRILENIEAASDFLQISIRINVDRENGKDIDKLVDFFLSEKKWVNNPSFYLAPVRVFDNESNIDETICFSSKEIASMINRFNRIIAEKSDANHFQRFHPLGTSLGCSALGTSSFVIGPSGELYTCWEHLGDQTAVIGNIAETHKLMDNQDYIDWLTIGIPDKCSSCNYYPICRGGCPLRRIKNGNNPPCDYRKLTMKESLLLEYEKYLEAKKAEEDVS